MLQNIINRCLSLERNLTLVVEGMAAGGWAEDWAVAGLEGEDWGWVGVDLGGWVVGWGLAGAEKAEMVVGKGRERSE